MAKLSTIAKFNNCFMDIFAYMVLLEKTCAVNNQDYSSVLSKVRRLFEDSADRAVKYRLDPRDYDQARFAMSAWVDETIMNMAWVHSQSWRQSLLQTEFYGTMNAGTEFFDRLNAIGPEQNAVRQIFYMCLGFGFKGQYALDRDRVMLYQLKLSHLKSLVGKTVDTIGLNGTLLFKTAYPRSNNELQGHRLGNLFQSVWRSWLHGGIWILPPVIGVAMYFFFTIILDSKISNLMIHVVGK